MSQIDAKELARKLFKCPVDCTMVNYEAGVALLAAALAVCARERDRRNREYYKEVLNKAKLSAAAWKVHETPILSEAERAAGERAADLRVKS